jgi:CopG family nickel-responsive transcriptional regulator
MEQDIIIRIGISVPDDLLDRFDEIVEEQGFSSRSEGIREAIRNYILHAEWMSKIQGDRIGIISIVYSQDRRRPANSLMQVRHENAGLTLSTFHESIDRDNCMDLMVLRGDSRGIKGFAEKMMAIKGVKHVNLTTILPDLII